MTSTIRAPRPDHDSPAVDPRSTAAGPPPTAPPQEARRHRFDLSASQLAGGALAAMTAAALGARLGVAGTIIGAALASVCAAVLGSVYTMSIRRTREAARLALRRATPVLRRPGGRRLVRTAPAGDGPRVTLTETDLLRADPTRISPSAAAPTHTDVEGWVAAPAWDPVAAPGPVRRSRPRRRMLVAAAVGSVVIFVIALAVIFGLETVSGRSLDGQTGHTTLGQLVTPAHHRARSDSSGRSGHGTKPATGRPSAPPSLQPSGAASADPSAASSGAPSAASSAAPTTHASAPAASSPASGGAAAPGGQSSAAGGSGGSTDSGSTGSGGTGSGGTGSGSTGSGGS